MAVSKACEAIPAACIAVLVMLAFAGTADEPGWQDLFQSGSLSGWTNDKGGPPGEGWVLQEGVLYRKARAGSLVSRESFLDFELRFEWKIARAGNSGVKYRLHRTNDGRWIGPEYQVLDDTENRDAKRGVTSAASLYDLKEPGPEKALRPVGEFNESRVVARGPHIEHWLNGRRVVDIDADSPQWRGKFVASKYNSGPDAVTWFARKAGPLMIQDHGAGVWFRNVRIRKLVEPAP